ncbi:LysR family transcriptional regulator [Shewanella sp. WXL01]|uniref:LysR family transcriptional regulator n=1 Tax=Shewanella maritima TaxID=2520507 RepID=A0A411PK28_9GAMM|nr:MULTISPECIES: LysR family transcriptional regulator [Shewanella]NKF50774.1 LysR family transcriptional regulator [Shewanella sp. WXL01]QBF83760.1 LysR family transcriptional regulator [Shewanella maritima]
MLITSERLMYLVTVADQGSFSAAARVLNVSPSAVNQMINNMEVDLDLSLFDRTAGKAPKLTNAGKAIYFQAQELMPRFEAIEKKVQSLKDGVETSLTIAVHGFTFTEQVNNAIYELTQEFPQLQVNIVDSEQADLTSESSSVDIVISPASLVPLRGLESKMFDKVHWQFVAATSHPLAKRRGELTKLDLIEHFQLLSSQGRVATPELIESLRYSPKVISCDQTYQIRSLLLNGTGFTMYPKRLAKELVDNGSVKVLKVDFDSDLLEWPVEVCWSQAIGQAGQWFIDSLLDE